MEESKNEERIRKISNFFSKMRIAHYVRDSSLYVPGKVTLVSIIEPMEIRVEQTNGMAVRILKPNDKVYIEVWKGVNGIVYGDAMRNIEVVYYGGRLEIRFLGEKDGDN